MIGFYNYTVILTYLSLASAVAGIFLAVNGSPLGAIWALLLSGLCDLFDGRVASTKKDRTANERAFGIQIDSLCDAVAFGVLPAVIAYCSGFNNTYFLPLLIFFVLAAIIRLAYFNVTEEERQQTTTERRRYFLGLPVTSSAIILPFFFCLMHIFGGIFKWVFFAAFAAVGILFITPIKVTKANAFTSVLYIILGIAEFICLLVASF